MLARPLSILMVSPNVIVGGAQKIMLYLAKGLQDRGHRVLIYTTIVDHAQLPAFARQLTYVVDKVKIVRPGGELANFTAIDNVPLLAWRLSGLRRRIRQLIREHRIDVVNPHNPPANWLCSFLPVPVVWSCHNNPMAFYQNIRPGYSALWPSKTKIHHRMLEAMYEGADYGLIRYGIGTIVSSSDKIARGIQQVYGRGSEAIPFALSQEDGIQQGGVSREEKFERMEREGLAMIQVGQLAEDKKPRFSLEVLEAVRHRIPRVRLSYVGDGTLRPALEQEVRQRGLGEYVSFLGCQDERRLADIYAAAHILLFPGTHQPGGIVPIEAIWKSVVPIVTDTSGVAELLLRHGLTTVAKPTVEAFTEQVCAIYARREELAPWLARVKESLQRELSYERFLDRYEACFEACRQRSRKR